MLHVAPYCLIRSHALRFEFAIHKYHYAPRFVLSPSKLRFAGTPFYHLKNQSTKEEFTLKKFIIRLISAIFVAAFFVVQTPIFAHEISEVVSIAFLDSNYVSLFKTKYIDIEGAKYKLGARDAMSFENSDSGRKLLAQNVPEPFLSNILKIWSKSVSISKAGINETVSINHLDDKSVVISKTKHIAIDGVDHVFDEPQVIHYENSARGRELFVKNIPDPFYSAVMSVWGDTPTVILPVEIEDPNLK